MLNDNYFTSDGDDDLEGMRYPTECYGEESILDRMVRDAKEFLAGIRRKIIGLSRIEAAIGSHLQWLYESLDSLEDRRVRGPVLCEMVKGRLGPKMAVRVERLVQSVADGTTSQEDLYKGGAEVLVTLSRSGDTGAHSIKDAVESSLAGLLIERWIRESKEDLEKTRVTREWYEYICGDLEYPPELPDTRWEVR